MKRGQLYALVGLLLGLTFGLGVRLAERSLGTLLMELLADEVKKSCPCELKYDNLKVSLLRLTAFAENVRIEEAGEPKLVAPRIEADFDISDVFDKTVAISDLRILSPHSEGVGPESTTYRFIDHLSTPLPPEESDPDRWELRLEQLRVRNGTFTEPFAYTQLEGAGVTLGFDLQDDGSILLTPQIANLVFRGGWTDGIRLGSASALLRMTDDFLYIDDFQLRGKAIRALGNAIADKAKNYELSGTAQINVSPREWGAEAFFEGELTGEATIDGPIGDPHFVGHLTTSEGSPIPVTIGGAPPLPLDKVFLKFDSTFTSILVPEAVGNLGGIDLKLSRPLRVREEEFSGTIALSAAETPLFGSILKGLSGTVVISGLPGEPSTATSASAESLALGGFHFAGSRVQLDISSNGMAVKATGLLQNILGEDVSVTARGTASQTAEDSVWRFTTGAFSANSVATPSALQVHGEFEGPLDLQKLSSDGTIRFQPRWLSAPLEGGFRIENGTLEGAAFFQGQPLELGLSAALIAPYSSTFSFEASQVNPFRLFRQARSDDESCAELSMSGKYSFSLSAPKAGDGTLTIVSGSLGCKPYRLSLPQSQNYEIANGALRLAPFTITGEHTSLSSEGTMSLSDGFNLAVRGQVFLESFLPLLPRLDELRGRVGIRGTVLGPLADPKLDGSITIDNAELIVEDPEVSIRKLNGVVTMDDDRLTLDSLAGSLNTGSIEASGTVDLSNLSQSLFTTKIRGLTIEPLPDTSVTLDADLTLRPDETRDVVLGGVIEIKSGEFIRVFDVQTILRSVSRSVLRRPLRTGATGEPQDLPALPLDIEIRAAPGNFLVRTNWLETNARANFHVRGTLENPEVEGSAELLSGWLGLKDRRFDISTGRVYFIPPSLDPLLDLTAETTVRSREGDTVLVILQVSGSLSQPRFVLSSDRGFSEQELLRLLTASGEIISRTRVSTFSPGFEIDTFDFIQDRSFLGLGRLVRDLTRIDSLAIEPQFNPQRGIVEPVIVATKRLLDRLSLIGESTVAGTLNDARVRLLYELTPRTDVSALMDNQAQDGETSFGVDVAYLVYGNERRFLTLRTRGNRAFRTEALIEASRLRDSSRIRERSLPEIAERVRQFYIAEGYAAAEVSARCVRKAAGQDPFCREIRFDIKEGEPATIDRVILQGEALPEEVRINDLERSAPDAQASQELIREVIGRLTARLRTEGYLGARIEARYDPPLDSPARPSKVALVIDATVGEPVTFIFEGNRQFSAREFLDTINLFSRKQPFGSNTPNILLQNIDRLYGEAGFGLATISVSKERNPESRRITYLFKIDEGPHLETSRIRFVGNRSLTVEELRAKIEEFAPEATKDIFEAVTPIAEQVEQNALIIEEGYREAGFPHAAVRGLVTPNRTGGHATIEYLIDENAPLVMSDLQVTGWPEDVAQVPPPGHPITIPRVNRFIERVSEVLAQAGFLENRMQVTGAGHQAKGILAIEPGPRTMVGQIRVIGTSEVAESVVKEHLTLRVGSPWKGPDIEASRGRLLRLGLFTRVDIESEPIEGSKHNRAVIVRVRERNLQSLLVGAGANSEYGVHLFGEATDRSIFGDGRSLTLRLDTYYDRVASEISRGIASLTYADPDFLSTPYGFVSDIRFQKLDLEYQEFDLNRVSFANYVHRSYQDGVELSAGHSLIFDNLDNVTPDVILTELDRGHVTISSFGGLLGLDRRDDPLLPKRGFATSVNYLLASEALGSDANFGSAVGRFSFLYPLDFFTPRLSFGFSARAGSAWTFGGTEEVPISQRFYLGGRNTVRGFRENSLGPLGEAGGVIGGDLFFSESSELRYLIADSISLHAFLDAGGLFLQSHSVSANQIRESVGLGARYLSPIGPVGLDVGFPIDEKTGEPSFRFHFSIGTNF